MKDSPFSRFINLVTIDQKIKSCLTQKSYFDTAITEVIKQKNEHAVIVEQAHQRVNQLKKTVDAQELEMKTLDAKEQAKKRILDTLSDYKECQAIKSEVDAIQRTQVEQEKIVLDAWAQLENAQNVFQKKQLESADVLQKYDDELQKIEQSKNAVSIELAELVAKREENTVGIPEEWLEKYGLMGQQVTNPVVPIEQQSCGGCYQQLTMQDIVRARHGAIMQCKKCFRLLYSSEIMERHSA